jgi:peptidoglycan L-alanyl-D-glutamate endopeptidase CwlK
MSILGIFSDGEIKKIEEELQLLKEKKLFQDMARLEGYEKQFVTDNDAKLLAPLHPIFKVMVRKTLVEAGHCGLKVGIFMGGRTMDVQAKLYAQGRKLVNGIWTVVDPKAIVTNAKPGYSWHQYFLAVDIVMDGSDKPGFQPTWQDFVDNNKDGANDWMHLGVIGKSFGMQWGGDFKAPAPVDVPHFQYHIGITEVEEALALYNFKGLDAVWARIG